MAIRLEIQVRQEYNSHAMKKLKSFWAWLRKDKKRLIGAVILVFVLIFGISRQISVSKNKVTYQTKAASKGTVISLVSASGQILVSNLMNVDSQASGVVKTVYVKDGQKVYAGQAIASVTLDSEGALANAKGWATLQGAQNSYRSTQASVANVLDQVKGHSSDETFVQKETRTKAEVANDNAYVGLAAAALSYRLTSPVITAPITGTIDNITIVPGMLLTNSSTTSTSNRVAVVTRVGTPLATFNVSEVDVNRVKQGQKATITLDSISGKTFTGKVLSVDKVGTVASGVTNYPVIISLDTAAPEILPNMAATANIIIESKSDVIVVPSDSVQTSGDGTTTIRILKNGAPVEVPVELGLSSDTQTEITSGLSVGDMVITGQTTGNPTTTTGTSPFSTFRVGSGAGGGRTGGAGR